MRVVAAVACVVVLASLVAHTQATRQSDEVAVLSVPHKDTEWESLTVVASDQAVKEFFAIDYDASAFVPSSAPYGLPDPQNRWECPYNKLSAISATSRDVWPANKDLLLRRFVDLPAGVSTLEVKITAHKAVAVFVNGQAVTGEGSSAGALVTPGGLCAAQDNVVFSVPDRFVRTGGNLLAVHVKGDTELNYFDMQVRAFYPRPTGDAGNVYVWGKGYYGVLGNGYETDSFVPGRILDLKELNNQPLKQLAMGVSHTVLLTEGGAMFAWGRGKEGQLGVSEEYSEVPLAVAEANALGPVAAIAAGSLHTLFLDGDGRVYCYGNNANHQCGLGEGSLGTISSPQRIGGLEDESVAFIGAKDSHSAAVTDEGKLYVWGRGRDSEPRYVDMISDVKEIAVGSHHVLVLDESGVVRVYGEGEQGQLGLANGAKSADRPTEVEGLQGLTIARIAAGTDNSFAITGEGKVFVWGGGSFGKNGLGVWAPQHTPTEVVALGDHVVKGVGAGMTATLFLTDKGHVYVSGANLRDGTHVMSPTFWASASDKYFVDVHASHLHFAALTKPSVWDWTKVDNYFEGTMKSNA